MFYVASLALVLGIAARSLFDVGVYDVGFFILIALLPLATGIFMFGRSAFRKAFLISTALLFLVLGLARADAVFDTGAHPELSAREERRVQIAGFVSSDPVLSERGRNSVVEVERVGGKEISGKGRRALIHGSLYPELSYGDEVIVSGELRAVENFETDTGRIFAYRRYLAKDGVHFRMFRPEIEIVGKGGGSVLKRSLFSLKKSFINSFSDVVPEPNSALLAGITVGAEDSMGEALEEDFRDTGIIHIVVLSGYNVTIVADFFMRLLNWAPLAAGSLVGGASIILFAILTGASATIVRASIMALLVIAARLLARRYDITRALVLAGVIMIFENPYILLYDPGFQLSFLATFGLIYLAPLVEARLGWLPTKWKMREFATATIATQLFVLPFLLYMTGKLSVVALPVNLLILPVVPLAMFGGLITGVAGFLSQALAFIPALPTFALLEWMLRVVDFFARLPFATVSIPTVPLWAVLAAYTGFALWLWKKLHPTSPARTPLTTVYSRTPLEE